MNDTRREFLKKTMLLTGAAGMATLPLSIQSALAIDPAPGSTYLDAEHVVLLMQENRSFDHTFGTLRGVRGFNDPRAITLPDKNKVWLQTNAALETYAPFRLDIKDTKITWMGSLPHGRKSQTEARNNGRHDNWIEAKKSDDEAYANMPLTMGYYTRADIPFYYSLADAFTVCDQNFCSSLTPTDPNRLYFWSGTIRAKHHEDSKAHIDNGEIEKGVEWRTFPELLEENNISWKVYQNEISAEGGFTEEEDTWLASFGDNPLEYFRQYNIKLSERYINYLPKKIAKLENDIQNLGIKIHSLSAGGKELEDAQKQLKERQDALVTAREEQKTLTKDKFENLSASDKAIHKKAFVVNSGDPYQHQLTPLNYNDGNTGREINIPKGDVLHQFREDVNNGNLPTVSWLVAPEAFSDHPSSPWFGSWYLSEAVDILTKNPDIWRKTIFILAYDENDGYFDHVPPFVPPDHRNQATGAVSKGIDTSVDFVKLPDDIPGPIGLGFRVPLIIASPWSRGGKVNSQVFDHTSTLQFLEVFLSRKFGKKIRETNITQWRRTVCGDLTSAFHQYNGEKITRLPFIKKVPFIESIHKAKFKNMPSNYKQLTKDEIEQINKNPAASRYMPQQEKGIRSSCAIPYEISANGNTATDKRSFQITLGADNKIFKDSASGSPFVVYSYHYLGQDFLEKNYAITAGDKLKDTWLISDFAGNNYHLQVRGPNGFFRDFKGSNNDPGVHISLAHRPDGNVEIKFANQDAQNYRIEIADNAYKTGSRTMPLNSQAANASVVLDLSKSFGWYDFSIKIKGYDVFQKHYAGHVETGKESKSDPAIS